MTESELKGETDKSEYAQALDWHRHNNGGTRFYHIIEKALHLANEYDTALETLCKFAIDHSLSTGHADNFEDAFNEILPQISRKLRLADALEREPSGEMVSAGIEAATNYWDPKIDQNRTEGVHKAVFKTMIDQLKKEIER